MREFHVSPCHFPGRQSSPAAEGAGQVPSREGEVVVPAVAEVDGSPGMTSFNENRRERLRMLPANSGDKGMFSRVLCCRCGALSTNALSVTRNNGPMIFHVIITLGAQVACSGLSFARSCLEDRVFRPDVRVPRRLEFVAAGSHSFRISMIWNVVVTSLFARCTRCVPSERGFHGDPDGDRAVEVVLREVQPTVCPMKLTQDTESGSLAPPVVVVARVAGDASSRCSASALRPSRIRA